MSVVDLGIQQIIFKYKTSATGAEFEKFGRGIVKPGIYSGGVVTNAGNDLLLAPFNCLFNVDSDKIAQITTSANIMQTITFPNDIFYMTYAYLPVGNNYIDFGFRQSSAAPVTNEITLCKVTWNVGTGLVATMDNSVKTYGLFDVDYNGRIDGTLTVTDNPTTGDMVGNLDFNDDRYMSWDYYSTILATMQSQLEHAELKLLENDMEISYLTGRHSNQSDWMQELFFDEELSNENWFTDLSVPAEICDDTQWNNNWKEVDDVNEKLDFKNGFLRPRQIPYMLENIDEYDLGSGGTGAVGQTYKSSLSKYDSINECYWMISNGGANAIGEITKLGKSLKDGRVQELGKWYLGATGAGTTWSGIAVNSLGTKLVVTLALTDNSQVYEFAIKTGGLIGVALTRSMDLIYNVDATLDYTDTDATVICDSTVSMRVGQYLYNTTNVSPGTYILSIIDATSFEMSAPAIATNNNASTQITDSSKHIHDVTATSFIPDITEYSATEWCYILVNGATAVTLKFIKQTDLSAGTTTTMTGFQYYINGTDATGLGRSICYDGTNMWIKMNDIATSSQWIYKFKLSTDVVSNVVIKNSGRFTTVRKINRETTANEGISVSAEGDILEVISTASNGKFICRHAVRNALWAENHVASDFKMTASTNPNQPHACMVEPSGCFWTGDSAATAQEVDVYKFNTTTGLKQSVRLIGATRAWTGVWDMTTDGTTVWILGWDSTNYEVVFAPLATLVAALSASDYDLGATIDIDGWTLAAGIGAASTNALYGICYDSANTILYLLNDTDDKIDTLSLNGATWTQAVYDLPAPTNTWRGIAYKNSQLFVQDYVNTTTPNRIFVIPLSKANATAMYRSHIYQDMSKAFVANGQRCFDFNNNDIVSVHYTDLLFTTMKTLEDPDVMQLHTFLDAYNVLLSTAVSAMTPIVERYFDPEDFADARDCPDPLYCGVCYNDNGFSELHLAEYLSGKSSTGKDRYDVTTIRTRHYKEGATNIIYDATGTSSCILIEKDMIFVGDVAGYFKIVDLKSGKCTILYTGTSSGFYYNGSLTERNDSKGYAGILNPELNIGAADTRNIHARTFFKDDVSDYGYTNPKTYVAIGTYTAGTDILIIDWDSEGNRTLAIVYNNVWNSTVISAYGNYIAPSGYLFAAHYGAGTKIWQALTPIWELHENLGYDVAFDNTVGTGSRRAVGYLPTAVSGAYPWKISPNSSCWKTASGTWKHKIIYTVYSGHGVYELECETISNTIAGLTQSGKVTWIQYNALGTGGRSPVDNYEDRVFTLEHNDTNTGYIAELNIMKRLTFADKGLSPIFNTIFYNGWSYSNQLSSSTRPRYNIASRYIDGDGDGNSAGQLFEMKFSPNVNKLLFGCLVFGIQIHHFYSEDSCQHKSMTFETTNPSNYVYHQTLKK